MSELLATPEKLERKDCAPGEMLSLKDGHVIEGYASLFGRIDRGGDIVEPGAYARSLAALEKGGRRVKMLWQHDPSQPIGVWEEVHEDGRGLYVKGRILEGVARGREAAELLAAGAIDGLSIGYRTVKSQKDDKGRRRLTDLELWEVSLVTFPMLPDARIGGKGTEPGESVLRDLAAVFETARHMLARS
ncbi:MAG: HK97 family phage prohead protease [Pseudomonadota bacterium]